MYIDPNGAKEQWRVVCGKTTVHPIPTSDVNHHSTQIPGRSVIGYAIEVAPELLGVEPRPWSWRKADFTRMIGVVEEKKRIVGL